ncbi:hypothetical protein DVH24_026760 [Malus domestica]|uniref:CCHC-type domain-containing protein n=1 Tax=Malus domestica TaxID=3750 RepID=A0A498K232_MALDO|nr:hypothetical protein DVH24_026760 [Malus domestica]
MDTNPYYYACERLQDTYYRCGRIGHSNTECSFEAMKCGMAGYGEWTKAASVRDFIESPRPLAITSGKPRYARATRVGSRISNQRRIGIVPRKQV